jgi:ribonucleoside-triphosphate reductase
MTLDNPDLGNLLDRLRQTAVDTNKEYSKKLGINQSAAITCVKPSGTVSQLVDAASGIHPRYSKYYIRTVRADNKDPLTEFLKAKRVPNEPCVMRPDYTTVFSFPVSSPDNAVVTEEVAALDQLKIWLVYQRHWCEHKPSITIHVKDDEWLDVGAFVYRHFDEVSGISFLPYSNHSYKQAPYQPISEEAYVEAAISFPKDIDWSDLSLYEKEDTTVGVKTFACSGDVCEVVDLT